MLGLKKAEPVGITLIVISIFGVPVTVKKRLIIGIRLSVVQLGSMMRRRKNIIYTRFQQNSQT